MCRMRQDPVHPHVVATGGKENALKVWDLQGSEEPVFRAKNVSDLGPREAGATDHGQRPDGLWGMMRRATGRGTLAGHSPVPHRPAPPGTE